tara:strand:+ start:846 stop:1571 length:726 start_codon:yes stop_codon:yes gene_type:complete
MPCKRSEKTVNWVLSSDFIRKIRESLDKDKIEIAGKILFKDEETCKKDVCNKKSTEYKINRGNEDSVATPYGIINFHTHPKKCYIDANTVYGWPSGEDIYQCIAFARKDNLIHIVFTLEGAYIIKVNKIINTSQSKMVENILKYTHEFRGPNPKKQNELFQSMISILKLRKQSNPVNTWINLMNNMSLKNIYTLYNHKFKKNLTIPSDNTNVFSVELVKYGKTIKFNTNYISEVCHKKSFQ